MKNLFLLLVLFPFWTIAQNVELRVTDSETREPRILSLRKYQAAISGRLGSKKDQNSNLLLRYFMHYSMAKVP